MQGLDTYEREDWAIIESFLPDGWQEKMKELGAYRRPRAFAGAAELLRTLLIHIGEGHSFRKTAAIAEESGLAAVSDVALTKRLRLSQNWFRWMASGVIDKWLSHGQERKAHLPNGLQRVNIADASTSQESGSKGTSWRIHYSMNLRSLHCNEVKITGPKIAESFSNFAIEPGDLWIGDRGYAKRQGVHHVVANGGDVIVRLGMASMRIDDEHGNKFDLLEHGRTLRPRESGDWPATITFGDHTIIGRICAVTKSKEAAAAARKKIEQNNRKKSRKTKPQTLEATKYIFIFTTLDKSISVETIFRTYGARWQIELTFKRLKSLLGIGHLHKQNPESAKAWLYGKLLIACLIEALVAFPTRFFPWGYPLKQNG